MVSGAGTCRAGAFHAEWATKDHATQNGHTGVGRTLCPDDCLLDAVVLLDVLGASGPWGDEVAELGPCDSRYRIRAGRAAVTGPAALGAVERNLGPASPWLRDAWGEHGVRGSRSPGHRWKQGDTAVRRR